MHGLMQCLHAYINIDCLSPQRLVAEAFLAWEQDPEGEKAQKDREILALEAQIEKVFANFEL